MSDEDIARCVMCFGYYNFIDQMLFVDDHDAVCRACIIDYEMTIYCDTWDCGFAPGKVDSKFSCMDGCPECDSPLYACISWTLPNRALLAGA